VFEDLAGACGTTFFVWVQHHAPVRMLARSANEALRVRYLDELCGGRLLGGVAFAYLRRPGPPAVTARRVPGGYVVHGEAPWVTSWGLADVFAVAARLDGDVVFFLVEASDPALSASAPLPLAAMAASSTVRLTLDDLFVPDGDVLSAGPFEHWQAEDRLATAQPNPAAFGIAARCLRLLGDTPLAGELDELRSRTWAPWWKHGPGAWSSPCGPPPPSSSRPAGRPCPSTIRPSACCGRRRSSPSRPRRPPFGTPPSVS
jgi:alkylation response protein AidB-like acyl-CoA dehydrogenase